MIPATIGFAGSIVADRRPEGGYAGVTVMILAVAGLLLGLAYLFAPWHQILDPIHDIVGW